MVVTLLWLVAGCNSNSFEYGSDPSALTAGIGDAGELDGQESNQDVPSDLDSVGGAELVPPPYREGCLCYCERMGGACATMVACEAVACPCDPDCEQGSPCSADGRCDPYCAPGADPDCVDGALCAAGCDDDAYDGRVCCARDGVCREGVCGQQDPDCNQDQLCKADGVCEHENCSSLDPDCSCRFYFDTTPGLDEDVPYGCVKASDGASQEPSDWGTSKLGALCQAKDGVCRCRYQCGVSPNYCDPDCSTTAACAADGYCDEYCPPYLDPDCSQGFPQECVEMLEACYPYDPLERLPEHEACMSAADDVYKRCNLFPEIGLSQ